MKYGMVRYLASPMFLLKFEFIETCFNAILLYQLHRLIIRNHLLVKKGG